MKTCDMMKRKGIKVLPNIDEENLGSFDHKKDKKYLDEESKR